MTSPSSLSILVLGGTGFLGPHVVRAAKERGHRLTLLHRGKTNPDLFPDVERIVGDRQKELPLPEGRTWDAVVDNCGYVPRVVGGSASALAGRVGQYLFVSSISVYADVTTEGIREDAALATMEDESNEEVMAHYGALKALCERAAERAMPGRTTVVRPGLIVGPGDPTDRYTYWPVRVARGGDVLAPGDGSDPVQIVDVRDLAEWMVLLLEERRMGAFSAVGPAERMTMAAMLDACPRDPGVETRLRWVAESWLAAREVSPWGDMPVWTGKEAIGMGSVDGSKARAAGLRHRPVAETARDTLAWFRTLPEERRAKLRAGIDPAREAELLQQLGP